MAKRVVKYNPAFLKDDELVDTFSARHVELDLILQVLRENTTESNQHVLVIGPRGSGKTTLVLRAAAEIRRDPTLRERWYPLAFAEESYEVASPGEFWLEALFHLAQQTADQRWLRTYEDLKREPDEARLRERALAQLLDFADREQKRIVLIVENLNMLFDGQITEHDAWVLRGTLQHEHRIMLLATATTRFDEVDAADKALYELFRLQELKPLDEAECRALWTAVTGQEPSDGRIRPLQILTGGNPRLLAIVSTFGAGLSFQELMGDLLTLVDDHTEYFKSHLDNLPSTERKVYLALADRWDPATARDIALAARLDVNKTSSLLGRLVSRGAVLTVGETVRQRRYQVAERMYNIYHLIRRRGGASERVKAVVNFMVGFYPAEELVEATRRLAEEACQLDASCCLDHYAAYEGVLRQVPSREVRDRILASTPPSFLAVFEHRQRARAIGLGDLGTPGVGGTRQARGTSAVEKLIKKAQSPATSPLKAHEYLVEALRLAPQDPNLWIELGRLRRDRLWTNAASEEAFRKALELVPGSAEGWRELGELLGSRLGRVSEAEEALRKAVEVAPEDPRGWIELGNFLRNRLGRHDQAMAAFRKAIDLAPENPRAWQQLGRVLAENLARWDEGEAACRKAVELAPEDAFLRSELAWILAKRRDRIGDAEHVLREATTLTPQFPLPWINLGNFLSTQEGKSVLAEQAFRAATEVSPKHGWAWVKLAGFLAGQSGKEAEAKAAFRRAIALEPTDAWNQIQYARFLEGRPGSEKAAEAAYHRATELEPGYSWAWVSLAIFLRDRVQRLDDAEAAISKATEVEPGYGYAWAMLAEFLAAKGRMEEAERAYRKATEVEPGDETGWGNLGWFLHHGRGDYAEADHAYRKALELEPSDPWTWRQLGQLLHEAVGRYSEAEEAYRKAIELDADDASTWGQLGRLLEEKLGRYAEAEEAYRKALALEPKQTGGWALLARLLHNHLGRPEEAEASFRRAVDLNPNDPQGWASFGQFLHGTPNRADEADAAYTRALELDPGMLPALLGRVQLLLRKPAASDEALRVAQDYLLKVEDDPNALRMASELFVRFGVRSHLPDVVKWTRKAVELRPDDALAHRVLAAASTGLGAEKDALSSAERYVNDAVVVEANVKDAIDLFVRLAAAGWGKQALDLLQRSPSAHLLEPLVVGLQLYLGEDVVAAAEILEVGRDVADRIRSRAGRAKDESVLTDQASVPVDGGEKKPAPVKRGRKRS